jgi:hypothetical protein
VTVAFNFASERTVLIGKPEENMGDKVVDGRIILNGF